MKYIILILVILLPFSAIASELTCSGKVTKIETLRNTDSSLIRVKIVSSNDDGRFYKVCLKSVSGDSEVECQGHLAILLSAFHAQNDVDLVFKSNLDVGLKSEANCNQINEWGPYLSDVTLSL